MLACAWSSSISRSPVKQDGSVSFLGAAHPAPPKPALGSLRCQLLRFDTETNRYYRFSTAAKAQPVIFAASVAVRAWL